MALRRSGFVHGVPGTRTLSQTAVPRVARGTKRSRRRPNRRTRGASRRSPRGGPSCRRRGGRGRCRGRRRARCREARAGSGCRWHSWLFRSRVVVRCFNDSDTPSLRTWRPSGCLVSGCVASYAVHGAVPRTRVVPLRVGFTDLHCPLLPGVDDGPATMAESVEYAAAAAAAGMSTIVATPHVELVDVAELPDRVRTLRAALDAEGVTLDVRCGGELKPFSIPALSHDDLDTIAHGPPGARWLLYEGPFHGADDEFVAGARELRARGFGLLLAHPERSTGMVDGGGPRGGGSGLSGG